MPQRPPITTQGTVIEVRKPDQLYLVALANGHRAMGVREKHLPRAPEGADPVGMTVTLEFSPFDMSRCVIVHWAVA